MVVDQSHGDSDRLFVGEAVVASEGAPGVEAERQRDRGAQLFPASSACSPWPHEDVGSALPLGVIGRHDLVVAAVCEDAGGHRLGGAVVGVGLPQGGPQTLGWVCDRLPGLRVRWRVAPVVVAAAGAAEGDLVGEVALDGNPSYAGASRDIADRGGSWPERLVELDRGLDDPLAGALLVFGAALELVAATHLEQ